MSIFKKIWKKYRAWDNDWGFLTGFLYVYFSIFATFLLPALVPNENGVVPISSVGFIGFVYGLFLVAVATVAFWVVLGYIGNYIVLWITCFVSKKEDEDVNYAKERKVRKILCAIPITLYSLYILYEKLCLPTSFDTKFYDVIKAFFVTGLILFPTYARIPIEEDDWDELRGFLVKAIVVIGFLLIIYFVAKRYGLALTLLLMMK